MVRFSETYREEIPMKPISKYVYNKEGNMENNMRSFKNSSVAKYISDTNNNLVNQMEKQQKFVDRLRKANIEIRVHSTISKSPKKSC